MNTLLELAKRCEQATGPERTLDGLIFARLNPEKRIIIGTHPGRFPQKPIYGTPLDMLEMLEENGKDAADYLSAPLYTSSIDAAMTLLDESWFFHVSRFSPGEGGGQAHVYPNRGLGDDYEADAAKPALALCAAALRARAASVDRSPEGQDGETRLDAKHESAVPQGDVPTAQVNHD